MLYRRHPGPHDALFVFIRTEGGGTLPVGQRVPIPVAVPNTPAMVTECVLRLNYPEVATWEVPADGPANWPMMSDDMQRRVPVDPLYRIRADLRRLRETRTEFIVAHTLATSPTFIDGVLQPAPLPDTSQIDEVISYLEAQIVRHTRSIDGNARPGG